jgi:hypothetical protein
MWQVTVYFVEGGSTTIPIKARNAMVAKSQAKAWARTYEPSSTVRKVEAVRK